MTKKGGTTEATFRPLQDERFFYRLNSEIIH